MEEFAEYCRNFIKEQIKEFVNEKVYASELGYSLTDYINCNGTATYSTAEAKKYIVEWWNEAADYMRYEKDNLGENSNPFENPEGFMVRMIIWGVSCLIDRCSCIDENWNEQIVLTEDIIEEICNEIENNEIEY